MLCKRVVLYKTLYATGIDARNMIFVLEWIEPEPESSIAHKWYLHLSNLTAPVACSACALLRPNTENCTMFRNTSWSILQKFSLKTFRKRKKKKVLLLNQLFWKCDQQGAGRNWISRQEIAKKLCDTSCFITTACPLTTVPDRESLMANAYQVTWGSPHWYVCDSTGLGL